MRSDIELLRLFSAFGIVWFHSGVSELRDFSYAGLIVFIILSAYLAVSSKRKSTIGSRASRLLIPCIIWSLIYGVLKFIKGTQLFDTELNLVEKVLTTPSEHLWYLPFIFFCLILLDKIKQHLTANVLCGIFGGIACALLLLSPISRKLALHTPWAQYLHAVPALCIGIVLGVRAESSTKLWLGTAASIVCVLTLAQINQFPGIQNTYTLGVVASLLLLSKRSVIPNVAPVIALARASFGIYLSHIVFLAGLIMVGVNGFALPVFAFLLSMAFALIVIQFLPDRMNKYFV